MPLIIRNSFLCHNLEIHNVKVHHAKTSIFYTAKYLDVNRKINSVRSSPCWRLLETNRKLLQRRIKRAIAELTAVVQCYE